MKINDIVYVVNPSSLFDIAIKNSVSIYRAEILAISATTVNIRVEADTPLVCHIVQQVDISTLCTTPQQAFEQANKLILNKDQSYEQSSQQQS